MTLWPHQPSGLSQIVHEALALHARGFPIPVAPEDNANDYDSAYAELSSLTGGWSHMARTGDRPTLKSSYDPLINASWLCSVATASHVLLDEPKGADCPGRNLTAALRERYHL